MLCRRPSAAAVSLWEGGLRMVTGSRGGTELLLPFRNWKFNKNKFVDVMPHTFLVLLHSFLHAAWFTTTIKRNNG